MIVALAGGVGGARLAVGLAALVPPEDLTIVVNTGDDFEHLGFSISPDLDTVMYTLAGEENPQTGWGRRDETWSFMAAVGELGGETWFRLGDRDIAVHALRTQALARGEPLSQITSRLAHALGVRHALVPMSETPVRTRVATTAGELAFQDYFVRQQCAPQVTGFRYAGSDGARVPPALRAVFERGAVDAVVLCPSNAYISIGPILAIAEIRRWLETRRFPLVAVSPIVGNDAVKGPAAKMMRELGLDVSALAVARHYGRLVDAWVIDERNAHERSAIEALGCRVAVADTLMTDRGRSAAIAAIALDLARRCQRKAA
ncbi:MAG TPA: 2-phospho-L-lactate transferase [Burkholderiales bacterium]|nr:2-phospho-L-lactate transferase [Burkholderiales bacterium]